MRWPARGGPARAALRAAVSPDASGIESTRWAPTTDRLGDIEHRQVAPLVTFTRRDGRSVVRLDDVVSVAHWGDLELNSRQPSPEHGRLCPGAPGSSLRPRTHRSAPARERTDPGHDSRTRCPRRPPSGGAIARQRAQGQSAHSSVGPRSGVNDVTRSTRYDPRGEVLVNERRKASPLH